MDGRHVINLRDLFKELADVVQLRAMTAAASSSSAPTHGADGMVVAAEPFESCLPSTEVTFREGSWWWTSGAS